MTEILREMWTARIERRMEDVFLAKARLQSALDRKEDFDLRQEILLIEASTFRQQGDLARADERVAEARSAFLDHGRPLSVRWHIEAGLNDFYRENFARALDSFLTATLCKADAAVPWSLLQAQINACLCFEYLSISSPKLISKVQRELKKKAARPHDMIRQWEAFENRRRFLNAERLRPPTGRDWSQNAYFYALATRIPLFGSAEPADLESELDSFPKEYLGGFRMRTLLEKEDQADLSVNKTSDLVERLYLWTWNTNSNPDRGYDFLNGLTAELASRSSESLTILDRYMFRAALEWRAVLDRGWSEGNPELLRRVRRECPYENAPPFFAREMEAIGGNLSGLASGPRLSGLRERLRTLGDFFLLVNRAQFQITRKGHAPVRSEPLARALALVAAEPICSCRDLLYQAFGNPEYDEIIHQGQLFNLLARMRELLGSEFTLTKRRHMIYAQGPFSRVHFTGEFSSAAVVVAATAAASVSAAAVVGAPVQNSQASESKAHPLRLLPPPLRGRPFSRRELEQGMGKSRASVNRLLSQWVRQDFVKTIGSGKSIRYLVEQKWSDT